MTSPSFKLCCLLATAFVVTTADAAPWDNSKQLKKMTEAYDLSKLENSKGAVENFYDITPPNSPNVGIHMIIKTDSESIDIHLGPGWYIKKTGDSIEIGGNKITVGDYVKVIGAKFEGPQNPKLKLRGIRAAEVQKEDGTVFKLRDQNGKPLWSGY